MLRARCQYAKRWLTSKALPIILLPSLIISLNACQNLGISSEDDSVPPYPFSSEKTWKAADSTRKAQQGWMYADTYTRPYYQQESPRLLWATERGIDERADTLLHYLQAAELTGLRKSSFHLDEISRDLEALRALPPDSCEEGEVCRLAGSLEYLLSEAYMRYAYGQRFGYVRPHKLLNNLLPDASTGGFRRIFDIHCDEPSDSLFGVAVQALESPDRLGSFLQGIQPREPLYHQLAEAWQEAVGKGDEEAKRLCAINLERSRWRYQRPTERKYVWVNLTDYMLEAVDRDKDSVLVMKVCIGDKNHKTPMLRSAINRLELNPYWVIPTSIVRNELIPRHLNDSSYYSRNRIWAINNQTGEQSAPWLLSADQLRSGRYTLRQEEGVGNSLGRMFFRFPNDFAVFLHDTNNHGAFGQTIRALSHGCVRVERPLDLAVFLMDKPDAYTIDRIRVAIGKKPLSGKAQDSEVRELGSYSYSPAVPVYLDYYTLYPDPRTGELKRHADNYGYDKEIEKILNQF